MGGDDSTALGCPLSGVASYGSTPTTIVDNQAKTGWTYSAYAQDEWNILPTVTINYGGRFDVVNGFTTGNQISPRLNAVWQATSSTVVHAGYASYFTPPPQDPPLVSDDPIEMIVDAARRAPSGGNVQPWRF